MKIFKSIIILLILFSPLTALSAGGGLSLSQTRIIFPSNRESVSISVINSDVEDVWLLRGWVNEFESEKKTDNFIITPPLYRLDPDSKIQLRI
ncbi:molecular chaperone, partial [Salmonella enterica subsp. enterica]|nr:molecular chaperone [Salmonella enterica subsp. enterica]